MNWGLISMNIKRRFVANTAWAAAIAFGCSLYMGQAHAVSITNGSFETGTNPGSFTTVNAGDTNITGWTVGTGSVDYIGSYWQASDGFRSIDLNGNALGSISQIITGLTIGTQYRVSFDLAGNPDNGPTVKTLSVTASLDSNQYNFDITGASKLNMGWVTNFFLFTANSPTALLAFTSTTTSPCCYGPALDNVAIFDANAAGVVPLPAALPLFSTAIGVMGLLGWRRKRKAQAALTAA